MNKLLVIVGCVLLLPSFSTLLWLAKNDKNVRMGLILGLWLASFFGGIAFLLAGLFN